MKLTGTISTTCVCDNYTDGDGGDCEGYCYEWSLEDFAEVTKSLFDGETYNNTYPFKIEGIGLWNRTVGGVVLVDDSNGLLRAMSVRGDFLLQWEFDEDTNTLGALLSHHDCPTGSWVTVTPMTCDEYMIETGDYTYA